MIDDFDLALDALVALGEVRELFLAARFASTTAVRAAVSKDDDPREVWERLAARELIPLEWIEHPRRGFTLERDVAVAWGLATDAAPTLRLPDGERVVDLSSPPTTAEACALALDPVGVAAAEDLAREYVARLRPFAPPGSLDADRVVWTAVNSSDLSFPLPPSERSGVPGAAVASALVARATFVEGGRPEFDALPARLSPMRDVDAVIWRPIVDAVRWRAAASERLIFPPSEPALPHAVGRKFFDEVPSPFEPLIALWRAGFALRCVAPEAIVMVVRYYA